MAPNIVFAPNMTQNAERKHRTQDTNTANFRSSFPQMELKFGCVIKRSNIASALVANDVHLSAKNPAKYRLGLIERGGGGKHGIPVTLQVCYGISCF